MCDWEIPTDAVQTYRPLSSSTTLLIFRVPLAKTWDLPFGSSPFTFDHVTVGLRSPVALQLAITSWLLEAFITSGGLTMNFGNDTTVKSVVAESEPSKFDAWHLYRPESCFAVLTTFSCPSWITIRAGKLPGSFDHVTLGGGYPVTWHFGKVKFVFSTVYVGPIWRVIRGRTKTGKTGMLVSNLRRIDVSWFTSHTDDSLMDLSET